LRPFYPLPFHPFTTPLEICIGRMLSAFYALLLPMVLSLAHEPALPHRRIE